MQEMGRGMKIWLEGGCGDLETEIKKSKGNKSSTNARFLPLSVS